MAKYKNITGDRVDARFIGRILDVDEVAEIPDEVAVQYDFSPEVWKEVTPPKPAAVAAHKRAIAAENEASLANQEPAAGETTDDATTKTEEV